MNKRPFLCRLGFHSWYMDGAMFAHADRCNNCDCWRHPDAGKRVEIERDAWAAGPPNEPMEDATRRVAEVLARSL